MDGIARGKNGSNSAEQQGNNNVAKLHKCAVYFMRLKGSELGWLLLLLLNVLIPLNIISLVLQSIMKTTLYNDNDVILYSRAYQLKMLEESLRKNVIVAVRWSSVM